jgi:hypothetical protein
LYRKAVPESSFPGALFLRRTTDSLKAADFPSPVHVVSLFLGQFTAPQSNGIALILRTDVSVAAPCARTKLAPNRTGPSACPKVGFDNACAETTAFVDWREDLPGPLFMIKTVK